MSAPRDRISDLRIEREAREPARTPKVFLGIVSVLLVAAAVAAGLWLARGRTPNVRLAPARELAGGGSSRETVLDASGYVVARLEATVSSKITGKIVEVLVEEGMAVEKGQVLARLDDSMAQRQVAYAEAQVSALRSAVREQEVRLEEARLDLRRTRELVEAKVRTEADLDSDKAEVDALTARIERSQEEIRVAERLLELRHQELDDTVIRAPFTGVAVTKNAQPGEMISPVSAGGGFTRTGVCTLVDMSSLEIEVDVNEAYINRVEPGQKVVATLDAYPDWKIPASVITTVPTADRQKATVRVRIAFDELDPRLLPDMGTKVAFLGEEIVTEEAAAPRVVVPADAVREEGESSVVFVFRDGAVERRAVRLGARRGSEIEIVAGVRGGERVVVEGPAELADGEAVSVL